MTTLVEVSVNGRTVRIPEDASVAAAIVRAGQPFRRSVTGQPRAPFCGMGVCFACSATIDGVPLQRTCMLPVREGMRVETDG